MSFFKVLSYSSQFSRKVLSDLQPDYFIVESYINSIMDEWSAVTKNTFDYLTICLSEFRVKTASVSSSRGSAANHRCSCGQLEC